MTYSNGSHEQDQQDQQDAEVLSVVVLGAGISGLVAASILLDQGYRRVTVIDEYAHLGGNHQDRTIDGYTFDVGSFVFQDDSPLLSHFPELLEHYVQIDPTWAKLTPRGSVTAYPFSLRSDLLDLGPLECARTLWSVIVARLSGRRMRNARDFARFWLGSHLLRGSGLENYIERFCGLPSDRIDIGFARQRMMWIAEHARVSKVVWQTVEALRRSPAPGPQNRQLARPQAGFATLYAPALESLERRGGRVVLGVEILSISTGPARKSVVTSAGEFAADRVVSTVPIDHARDLCGIQAARRLRTVTLVTLFFSFSGRRGFTESILYNFSQDGAWKRLTVHSDFYGRHDGREFFSVEVIGNRIGDSPTEAERDFRTHVASNGLFDGDLVLAGSNVLGHAYPIYTEHADVLVNEGVAALLEVGVESFGRQGGFQYQPTARVSTNVAERALGAPVSGP